MDEEEARVSRMIDDGLRITWNAIAEWKLVAVLAAFSGGNDSIVSTHFGAECFDATAVHCNTGIGISKTREHVKNVIARFGWRFIEGHAKPEGRSPKLKDSDLPACGWTDGATAYEEYVLNFGFPGPIQHPRMYQRLKQRVLDRIGRDIKAAYPRGAKILVISGIRHDESSIRAGYKRAVQREKGSSRVWVNPFYFHSANDFELYRQEFGLPRNPVKARIGISGECLCGSFAKPGERDAIRLIDPEVSAYIDALEARVCANGFPWGYGENPPKWFRDYRRGQQFLFPMGDDLFSPMCVGCPSRTIVPGATP